MPFALGAMVACLRGILYGVNIVDGVSFVGVSLLFLAIALFAAYLPSRQAMRVDPVVGGTQIRIVLFGLNPLGRELSASGIN